MIDRRMSKAESDPPPPRAQNEFSGGTGNNPRVSDCAILAIAKIDGVVLQGKYLTRLKAAKDWWNTSGHKKYNSAR